MTDLQKLSPQVYEFIVELVDNIKLGESMKESLALLMQERFEALTEDL